MFSLFSFGLTRPSKFAVTQTKKHRQPLALELLEDRTQPSIGTSFLAISSSESGFVPPDSNGDVSNTQILAVANGRIKVFDKAGNLGGLNESTNTFFAGVVSPSQGFGNTQVSDPHVRFDRLTGRWFVVAIDFTFVNAQQQFAPNRILVAVSTGSTITGHSSFHFFEYREDDFGGGSVDNGNFADYPTLGVDKLALYVGANMFSNTTGNFYGTTGWVINKASIIQDTLSVTPFRQLGTTSSGLDTPQGVNDDDPNATEGYFIAVDTNFANQLDIVRISNPGSASPTRSAQMTLSVPATTVPIPQVAKSSTTPLDALNDRLYAAAIHRDKITNTVSLWTAHTIQVDSTGAASASGGRNGSRWYQIGTLTGTPTLVQSGTLFDSSNTNTRGFWMPSVAMNGQGDMALGASYASTNDFAGVAVSGQLASEPRGSTEAPTLAVVSTSSYNFADNRNPHRWGDYSQTVVDPSDDMTMWTFQEYANATDSWGVRVLQILAPAPAKPTSASIAVNQGDTNVNVTVTGTSTNGSGFFDPGADTGGPGYANHLSASVGGTGVTVNSVTFTDPTHIILNLTVAANATPGSRTVTVTNPDGQALASASGILQINGSSVTHFSVMAAGSATAGAAFDVTVKALDASNNVVPTYTGTVHFTKTDSGAGSAVPGDYTFVGGDNGVHTFTGGVTFVTAGSQTVSVQDTANNSLAGNTSVTVSPAAADHLAVSGPSSTPAGTSFNFGVTAKDKFNNTAASYLGIVHFASDDTQATLPGNYTFIAGDAGVHTFSATLKTPGSHSLTATDTVTSSITGTLSGIAVNASTTTAAANLTTTFSTAVQTVSLSASVTSSGTVNEGSVTFTVLSGSTVIGSAVTASVTNGTAAAGYTLPAGTAGGSYILQAVYNGTATFAGSSDNSHTLTINAAASSTSASGASATFSVAAQTVSLSTSVTSPGGTVNEGTATFTILNGNTVVGTPITANVTSGNATANYTLPAGTSAATYTLKAVYNGTVNFISSTDTSHTLTVGAATTTVTVGTGSATFNAAAQAVPLSANITSPAGTVNEGTATFTIQSGSTVIGSAVTASVAGSAASVSYILPAGTAPGVYSVHAVYNGTGNFGTSTDTSHTLTINAASTTITAAGASATFSVASQSASLSATVTSAGGTVNEGAATFTILSGNTAIGSPVTVNVTSGGAVANYALPAGTPAGTYTLKAVYNGTVNFAMGSDSNHTLAVSNAATTTAAINASAIFNAAVQTVTLSAAITSAAGTVNEGTTTFTILSGNTPVSSSVTASVGGGTASVSYTLPAGTVPGVYTVRAAYNGTSNLVTSTDTSHTLTVNAAASTTTSANASATFSVASQNVSLSTGVTSSGGTVNEGTATFTILSGNTTIGSPVTVNVTNGSAVASYTLPAGTPAGTYTLKAVYNGTVNFVTSSDTSHTLTVGTATSTATASNASATLNAAAQTVSLSANITSAAGTLNEGTATFSILSGNTIIGSAVTANVASGAASVGYTLPAGTAPGVYTLRAVYNGTNNFSSSTDASHTLTINAAATTTMAASASATFSTSAQTVAVSATITSTGGTVNEGTATFTILSGNTAIGSPVTVNVASGNAVGNYTLSANTPSGTYTLKAVYNGTVNFVSSNDTSHVLNLASAAATIAAANALASFSAFAQTVTLTAAISSAAGTVNEGTTTFTILNGNTVIGSAVTANVVSSSASVSYALPASTAAGVYTLRAVYNGTSNFITSTDASHTLTINTAPTITSASSTTFQAGTAGSFTVVATGFPAPTLSESGALPAGVSFNATTGVLSGTPAVGTGGAYNLAFTASNGVGANATQNFTLTVNEAPAITSAGSATFQAGTAGTFTVVASGFPAPALSESGKLPAGVSFNATTGVLSGTPAAGSGGGYNLVFTASNGFGTNATQNFTLTVHEAPTITSASSTTFQAGSAGSFAVVASGFPAPTLSESGTLPAGVSFNASTGVLSGTPAAGSGRVYPIAFTASNGVGSSVTQSFTLTVNESPTITSANSTLFTVGSAGSFTVSASGFPAPTLAVSGTLPAGVSFNPSTGVLSGTPAAGSGRAYPITFTANNGVSSGATQNFTLTVNESPTITSANNTTFTIGSAGSFTLSATGFPAPTVTVSGALPSGVTFNPSTKVLSGTPAASTSGTYALTIKASNGIGNDATQSFTLTVSAAPAITSTNNTAFVVGSPGTFTVTATGFPAPALSLTSGNLPSGVTFNSSTGVLSGTPAAGTVGAYNLVFTASNGVNPNATQNFTLTVKSIAIPVEQLFVIGTDGFVYGQKLDTNGQSAGAYFLTQASAVKALTVGHDAAGRPILFVIGGDNQVYGMKFDANGNPTTPYFLAALGFVQSIGVTNTAAGNPELFALGLNQPFVFGLKLDTNGGPTAGYFLTQASPVKALAVVRDASGRPETFAIALDNQVYAMKFDTAGSPRSAYFLTQPGFVGSLRAGSDPAGNPELFASGLANSIIFGLHFDADGNTRGGYFMTQASPVQDFVVGSDASGRPELFVLGQDGQVYAMKFDSNGNPSSGYFLTQPGIVKALVVGRNTQGKADLFVIGGDDQVYEQQFDANGNSATGYFLTQPRKVKVVRVTT